MASNGGLRSATDEQTCEIHKAVFNGDLQAVRRLLGDIGNPTIPDMHGKQNKLTDRFCSIRRKKEPYARKV